MKLTFNLMRSLLVVLTLATVPAVQAAEPTTNQTLNLVAGWNAVWLEVEPVYALGNTSVTLPSPLPAGDARIGQRKDPLDVFANVAIVSIATPKPLAGLAEIFGTTPGTITTFNQEEWQRWKRSDPTDSNNLPSVSGNRPYLIECTAPNVLTLTGNVRFFRPTWTPDRYNLVDFGIDGAPTFQAFFLPSQGKHPVGNIFRLNASGAWQHVTTGDTMNAGEAYWIFSNGPSSYMGPVAVDFKHATTGILRFGGPDDVVPVGTGTPLDLEEIIFTNPGTTTVVPSLDLAAVDPGAGSLALHVVQLVANSLAYERGNRVDSSLPVVPPAAPAALGETVAPQATATLTLGAERLWVSGSHTNLYRLKTGSGSAFWLPISAAMSSLGTDPITVTPAASVTGLWVGAVQINGVSSIVVDGSPVQPTAGSAPLRVLLHSNSAGVVTLLSQVTLMQTKTADPAVLSQPVLVVDQAKIPFFEGIKERNGKRVGARVEAANYDMPRLVDATSQAALLADPTYTGPTVLSFLNGRSTRPPSLAEKYHLTWPMTGTLGAGATVQTTTALVLDPFHRSNPFRHAFHQNETRGPQISRTMSVTFDPTQTVSDRLRGTYTEVISGLTKTDLTLTGPIELRRLSTVSILDSAP